MCREPRQRSSAADGGSGVMDWVRAIIIGLTALAYGIAGLLIWPLRKLREAMASSTSNKRAAR